MKSEWKFKEVTTHVDPAVPEADAIKLAKKDASAALTKVHAGEAEVYAFTGKKTEDGGMDLTFKLKYCTDATPEEWLDEACPALDTSA